MMLLTGAKLTHLAFVAEGFYCEAVGADVHNHAQLEPICWVRRPHRLPIIHCEAQRCTRSADHSIKGRKLFLFMNSLEGSGVQHTWRKLVAMAASSCLHSQLVQHETTVSLFWPKGR